MNQRPIKSGYLQQQYIFGLRTTKFYYLEGTQFLIFQDDKTHVPEERIDLSGFIVDGIWQEEGYYTFVLRHVQNEIMWQFIALSYDDATEWVTKLKQAVLISEYESLLNQSSSHINIESSRQQQVSHFEINKKIPEFVNKQLKLYSEISKDKWIIEKILKSMKLMSLPSQSNIVLKGEYVFNTSLHNLITICSKGKKHLDLFQCNSQTHSIDENEYHLDVWQFQQTGKTYQIESGYIQFQFQKGNTFILTRESTINDKLPLFQREPPSNKNVIQLFKILEIIHIVEEDQKCYVQYIYIVKKDQNQKILTKFMKEQIINFSVISSELEILLQQIQNDLIPITHSRILTASDKYELDNSIIESDDCENIHFTPSDRLGYVDKTLPKDHPAYIHQQMHNRVLHLNEKQQQVLIEFKQKIGYLKLNDQTLIRFLIARNYKIPDAETMILRCLKWRKENNINSRKSSDYQQYASENVHTKLGFSRWGHPILVTNAMNSHPEKFGTVQGLSEKGYLEYHQSLMEEGIRSMRGLVDQFIVIIDCYQLCAANFSYSVLKNAFMEVFHYYPERQFKIFVLNTNFLTRSFYTMLKPFLPARTVEKINFIGQNFDEIKQALLKDLDEETIPMRYGGKNILIK